MRGPSPLSSPQSRLIHEASLPSNNLKKEEGYILSLPGSGQLAASFSRISVTAQKMGLENSRGGREPSRGGGQSRSGGGGPGLAGQEAVEAGRGRARAREGSGERRPAGGGGGLGRPLVLHRRRGRAGRGRGSVVPAHGQVHKGEHVELRHDGEAQEHAIEEKAAAPQLPVQLPLVQVDAKHLRAESRVRGPLLHRGPDTARALGFPLPAPSVFLLRLCPQHPDLRLSGAPGLTLQPLSSTYAHSLGSGRGLIQLLGSKPRLRPGVSSVGFLLNQLF